MYDICRTTCYSSTSIEPSETSEIALNSFEKEGREAATRGRGDHQPMTHTDHKRNGRVRAAATGNGRQRLRREAHIHAACGGTLDP